MIETQGKNVRSKRKSRAGRLAAAVIILAAVGAGVVISVSRRPARLVVDFFDVGQGDSELIMTPSGQTILIDGGPDDTVLRRLGDALPPYRRRIDYVLYSHYHSDHITGLVAVMKLYEVKNLVYAPGDYDSPLLETLYQAASAAQVTVQPITGTAQIDFGSDCFLNLLNPKILGVAPDENNSLVAKLSCAGRTFLFSGDNNYKVEKALLVFTANPKKCVKFVCDLRAEVFKASHHGSNTANTEAFLLAVRPRLMVISVGAKNTFNQPHPTVLARAAALGIEVKRTDQDGTVSLAGP